MITKLQMLSAEIYFTVCSMMHIIPWEWDKRKRTIVVTKSRWKKLGWGFSACTNAGLVLTMIGWLYWKVKQDDINLVMIILTTMMIILNSGSTVLNVIQITNGFQELATLIQVCLDVDKSFEVNFKGSERPKVFKIDFIGLVLVMFVPGILFVALCLGIFLAFNKNSIISWIDYDTRDQRIKVGCFLIRFCITYYLNLTFLAPMAIYVMSAAIFIQMSNYWTKTILIQPNIRPHLLRRYMEFKLLNFLINNHMRVAAPVLTLMALMTHVLSTFGTFRLYGHISLPAYMAYPAIATICMGAEVVLLPTAAVMYSNSEEFLHACLDDKALVTRKFSKAYKPVTIKLGEYGFVDQAFVLTFLARVIDETINLLMSIEE